MRRSGTGFGNLLAAGYDAAMRAKPDYYRAEADRSREIAKRCGDAATRAHLLDVAAQYEKLAEKAERGG